MICDRNRPFSSLFFGLRLCFPTLSLDPLPLDPQVDGDLVARVLQGALGQRAGLFVCEVLSLRFHVFEDLLPHDFAGVRQVAADVVERVLSKADLAAGRLRGSSSLSFDPGFRVLFEDCWLAALFEGRDAAVLPSEGAFQARNTSWVDAVRAVESDAAQGLGSHAACCCA